MYCYLAIYVDSFYSLFTLNFVIIFYIPNKNNYKANYFNKYLNSNYDNIYNITYNITDSNLIIQELVKELKNSERIINQAVLSFSIISLISLICLYISFLFNIYIFKDSFDNHIFDNNIFFLLKSIFIDFIDWSMALAILAKVNKLRKKLDKIEFTYEIKNKIIIVIILLSIQIIYNILSIILLNIITDSVKDSRLIEEIKKREEEKKNNKSEMEKKKIDELTKENESKDKTIDELIDKNRIKGVAIDGLIKQINEFKENNKIQKIKILNKTIELKENERLIPVAFTAGDQKFYYSMICKNTDKFAIIEQELYDVFPQYKNTENYFLLNGNKVNKNQTLEEINIQPYERFIL